MKKIYLIVGAILWGGIVDAQTLSVEQYRQKVLEYPKVPTGCKRGFIFPERN